MSGMPRIRQYADRDALKDLRGEIEAQGCRFGYKSQRLLADPLGVSQCTVGNWLRNPDVISLGDLRTMVRKLKLDPVIVLKALGYTSQDIKKIGRMNSNGEL